MPRPGFLSGPTPVIQDLLMSVRRSSERRLIGIAVVLAACSLAAGPAAERTLFKDLPPSEPVREVIQSVFDSPFYSMRGSFKDKEWSEEGFGGAWARARRYFPDRTYLVRPGTYFMTHGFEEDGRLFMEIHDSDYLELCAENRRTFTAGAIVAAYARMAGAADRSRETAFREKAGRLEPFFRDEPSHQILRKALGEFLYLRLIGSLREEDYHMLAGGIVHEGTHAGVEDALVARIQSEFKAGRRPVQWDELRAFMAESDYHGRFWLWAAGEIAGSRRQIESALRELEALRRNARLRPGREQAKFERNRVRCWAHTALVRLRMRELWQSTLRVRALLVGFQREYVQGDPPGDIVELLSAYDRDTEAFVEASGKAVQETELGLRSLEETLDQWSEWASGRRPFPPPLTDSNGIVRQLSDVAWPDPPSGGCRSLMKRAKEALEKDRPS
jgi:hypothetical protein